MTLSPPSETETAHRRSPSPDDSLGPLADDNTLPKRTLPPWVAHQIDDWGDRLSLPEWVDDEKLSLEDEFDDNDTSGNDFSCSGDYYRISNGWKGSDLCHSATSPVRISHYAVQYNNNQDNGIGTKLTGVAHFTPNAESHSGFCHGGSMTAAMDDVIGWTSFHVTGQCVAWSGFTAQVNVSLRRPIPVGSYLKIVGEITKVEGRKVWVTSCLVCGNDDNLVYCTAEGLAIMKK